MPRVFGGIGRVRWRRSQPAVRRCGKRSTAPVPGSQRMATSNKTMSITRTSFLKSASSPAIALVWAGLPSASLPPKAFDPVGVEFVVGSVSAPGVLESAEHKLPKEVPLRRMYLADRPGASTPEPTINMLIRHGVRSALEYARSGDAGKARALSNPDLSPHLSFVDLGGHGYATVRATAGALETEFVCIPRPIDRSPSPDGGPLRYRVSHRARLWKRGERPALEQRVLEGTPTLSI